MQHLPLPWFGGCGLWCRHVVRLIQIGSCSQRGAPIASTGCVSPQAEYLSVSSMRKYFWVPPAEGVRPDRVGVAVTPISEQPLFVRFHSSGADVFSWLCHLPLMSAVSRPQEAHSPCVLSSARGIGGSPPRKGCGFIPLTVGGVRRGCMCWEGGREKVEEGRGREPGVPSFDLLAVHAAVGAEVITPYVQAWARDPAGATVKLFLWGRAWFSAGGSSHPHSAVSARARAGCWGGGG